jgi:hypothetical protein
VVVFCDQEQFGADVVEAVTGVKPATLRQWEKRGIYTCELRCASATQMSIIQAPDTPRRRRKAVELRQKYEHGWRSYTLGDLVRISFIVALMEAGVGAREAGRGAVCLDLPESNPNSDPAGRALIRLLSKPDLHDEYVVYVPKLVHLNNPAIFRCAPANLDKVAGAMQLIGERAAAIANLSRMRRSVLQRLEQRGYTRAALTALKGDAR